MNYHRRTMVKAGLVLGASALARPLNILAQASRLFRKRFPQPVRTSRSSVSARRAAMKRSKAMRIRFRSERQSTAFRNWAAR